MELLSTCDYVTKMKKVSKDEVQVEVQIPGNYISEQTDKNVEFLIIIGANFPLSAPKVLSKTGFCFPNISDGRDLLEDIINNSWHPSYRVLDVINRIPVFCQEFMKSLNEGILTLVGAYYLGDKYDLSFLETLPVHLQRVKEKVMIDGKEKELQRILLVSDIYICLFEQDKWNKNNLILIFWSNLRSLVTIKKTINGDVCKFYWKQKNKKKNFELILFAEKSSILIEMILDRMSRYGINYKINKNIPRSGKIPDIDIETVEKSIFEIEQQIEQNPDLPHVEYLMDLYSKAVEYYSATNDPKFEYYKNKIHETLSTPRMNTFLSEETEHEDNMAKEHRVDKQQRNNKNEIQNEKVISAQIIEKDSQNNEKENSISTDFSNRVAGESIIKPESETEKNKSEKPKVENKSEEIIDTKINPANEEQNKPQIVNIQEKANVTENKEANSQDYQEDVNTLNKFSEQHKPLKDDKESPKEEHAAEKTEIEENILQSKCNISHKVEKEESKEQDFIENKEAEKPSASKEKEELSPREKSEQVRSKAQVDVKNETVQEKPKAEEKEERKDKIEVKLEIEEDENIDNIQYSSGEDD